MLYSVLVHTKDSWCRCVTVSVTHPLVGKHLAKDTSFTLVEATKGQKGSMYISTLSLTSALHGVNATPQLLYPRETLGTRCVGD